MNIISFMTANFVARELDYKMTGGWGQGDKATNDYFQPVETYAGRFEALLREIEALDFQAIDLWLAHLNPAWATAEHSAIARDLLQQYHLPVVSLAGWFGSTPEEFEVTCRLAVALDTHILGGSTSVLEKDRPFVVDRLQHYGLKLGLENHPEKTPEVMLAKIGGGSSSQKNVIGATVDTGWYGTQGYDAAEAIRRLDEHIFHVHLKDVLAAGAHETCRFGRGVVPVRQCVRALQAIGYEGAISVEHEPEHFDPTEDCKISRDMLRSWLQEEEAVTA